MDCRALFESSTLNHSAAHVFFCCLTAYLKFFFSVLPKKNIEDTPNDIEFNTFYTQMRYVDHSFDNLRRYKRYKHFQYLQYDQRYRSVQVQAVKIHVAWFILYETNLQVHPRALTFSWPGFGCCTFLGTSWSSRQVCWRRCLDKER